MKEWDPLSQIQDLQDIAVSRDQSLAQMALAWVLREEKVTSVIIGASKKEQIIENVQALENLEFSKKELDQIDEVLKKV